MTNITNELQGEDGKWWLQNLLLAKQGHFCSLWVIGFKQLHRFHLENWCAASTSLISRYLEVDRARLVHM